MIMKETDLTIDQKISCLQDRQIWNEFSTCSRSRNGSPYTTAKQIISLLAFVGTIFMAIRYSNNKAMTHAKGTGVLVETDLFRAGKKRRTVKKSSGAYG